jgi:predicted hydrocarbon binding protein
MLSAFLKKLIFARQFCIIDGKIEILGMPQLMFPSEVLLSIQDINQKKSYEITKKKIHESMSQYAKKIGTTSEGMIKTLKDIFETFGIGKIEIVAFNTKKKQAIIRVFGSPTCMSCKGNKTKGCSILPGALAGTFSFIFSKDVNSKAVNAGKTNLNKYCEFLIK